MTSSASTFRIESLLRRIAALEQDAAQLKADNALLQTENVALRAENERLKQELAAAKKNSRNSSKPPSSDMVKPPRQGKKKKRKIGGQPGHKANFRTPFTPEQLDETHLFDPPSMVCDCGGSLSPRPVSDQVQQQVELRENPLIRREYRARAYRCSCCGKFHQGHLPDHVRRQGFIGERLAATLAFLNVKAHASYSALVAFMTAVCGEYLSRGQIAKTLRLVAKSLDASYNEVLGQLRDEPVLNIDETGHREKGKRFWTWVFRAGGFAVFHIDKSRSSQVLKNILGPEYSGTIGCDYYGAYHKYLRGSGGQVQFCLAHLIRELRFLRDHSEPDTKKYAIRCLGALGKLFKIYHRPRDNPNSIQEELNHAKEVLWRTIARTPPDPKAENIAKRFMDIRDPYFTFISNPKIEPTNNLAEQAIRQVVIDRAASQGTRSQQGRSYKERMWTTISTCAIQGVSAYKFLVKTIHAHANGLLPPSLLPQANIEKP